jgi:hypothetical protein
VYRLLNPLHVLSVNSCGPKGQENLAQGLPWVKSPYRIGPERAVRNRKDWPLIGTVRIPTPAALSGLNTFFWLTQGKPWAKFSWPFGPSERAKHLQSLKI